MTLTSQQTTRQTDIQPSLPLFTDPYTYIPSYMENIYMAFIPLVFISLELSHVPLKTLQNGKQPKRKKRISYNKYDLLKLDRYTVQGKL